MAKAAVHARSFQTVWVVKKKSHEWVLVAIASAVGFAIVIALIALFELSAAK